MDISLDGLDWIGAMVFGACPALAAGRGDDLFWSGRIHLLRIDQDPADGAKRFRRYRHIRSLRVGTQRSTAIPLPIGRPWVI